MKTKWIPLYLGMVLFCLLAFRLLPSLLVGYGKEAARHDLVQILTSPLSAFHHEREKASILGNGNHMSDGSWQCQYGLVHVIQTRFMEQQGDLHDLAQARLKLFQTFTLPSMMQQTSKQFLWIIWTDPNLHGPELERIIQLVSRVPNAILMARDNDTPVSGDFRSLFGIPESDVNRHILEGSARMLMDFYQASQSRLVVETRLDADDAVARTFVESIQSHAARTIGQQVDNEKRIQVFCPEHHVEWRYYKPSDEEFDMGHLIHFHNKQICINSGLSIAYHLHASHKQLQFLDTAGQSYNNVQQRIPICDGGGAWHLRGGLKASEEEAQLAVRHKELVEKMMARQQQEAAELQTAAAAVMTSPADEEASQNAFLVRNGEVDGAPDLSMNHLSLRHRQEAEELSARMEEEVEALQARLEKRHPNYINARNSNECWRTMEMLGEDKQSVNTFQVAIVLARTPMAAGMNNVMPKRQFTSRYSVELPTYESPEDQQRAWESIMAVEFHLHANTVQQMRRELEQNMKNIVMDALAGQCTKGHSCKPSSKKALISIVDMLEERESSSTRNNEVIANSALAENQMNGGSLPSSNEPSYLHKAINMVVDLVSTNDYHDGESSIANTWEEGSEKESDSGHDMAPSHEAIDERQLPSSSTSSLDNEETLTYGGTEENKQVADVTTGGDLSMGDTPVHFLQSNRNGQPEDGTAMDGQADKGNKAILNEKNNLDIGLDRNEVMSETVGEIKSQESIPSEKAISNEKKDPGISLDRTEVTSEKVGETKSNESIPSEKAISNEKKDLDIALDRTEETSRKARETASHRNSSSTPLVESNYAESKTNADGTTTNENKDATSPPSSLSLTADSADGPSTTQSQQEESGTARSESFVTRLFHFVGTFVRGESHADASNTADSILSHAQSSKQTKNASQSELEPDIAKSNLLSTDNDSSAFHEGSDVEGTENQKLAREPSRNNTLAAAQGVEGNVTDEVSQTENSTNTEEEKLSQPDSTAVQHNASTDDKKTSGTATKQIQKTSSNPSPVTRKKPTKILYQGVDRQYIIPKSVKDIRDLTDKTYEAELYIKSDDHPEHISFTLYDVRTKTIVAERNSTTPGEKIFVVPLQTGHYWFEIKDSAGDGLCCSGGNNGKFEFYMNKKRLVEGSDFGVSSGKKEFKLYTNGFNKLFERV